MMELLYDNPILVLCVIIAIGYVVGRVRIGGFSLGIAAVLFAGLGVSAFDHKLALPQIVYLLGLVLFVYTIGLSSGPGFFRALRARGLRDNLFALGILLTGAGLAVAAAKLFHIKGELAVGMYTGAFTNTPALAAVLETLEGSSQLPVVGYSLAYPLSVVGVLVVISVCEKVWRIRHSEGTGTVDTELYARTVRVLRSDKPQVGMLASASGAVVSVSRINIGQKVRLARPLDVLRSGMLVTIVGSTEALDRATAWLGEHVTSGRLELDHSRIGSRRVFLSNHTLAGRTLGSLDLLSTYGVTVTRIRRGDVDVVAHDAFVLELGDRVKIVGPHARLPIAAAHIGDSYKHSAEFDILSFAIGISLGLVLGLIPIPLPGGNTFHLGAAGGVLVAALFLGMRGRTGRIVWQLPFGANMALRHIGIVLFLAGIGSQAGGALAKALVDPSSIVVIAAGAVLTAVVAAITLTVGYKVLHIPFRQLTGMLAGLQTQPAALAFAQERTKSDAPNIGYASVYPIAMIGKIILAQLTLLLLG